MAISITTSFDLFVSGPVATIAYYTEQLRDIHENNGYWTAESEGASTGVWTDIDLSKFGISGSQVVEVVVSCSDGGYAKFGGVRTKGSSIDRYLDITDIDGGPVYSLSLVTMHVMTDQDAKIQFFAEHLNVVQFRIVGNWSTTKDNTYFRSIQDTIHYTETLVKIAPSGAGWQPYNLNDYGIGNDDIVEIVLGCRHGSLSRTMGAREIGSTLDRYFVNPEAEVNEGYALITTFVKASGTSGIVELYTDIDDEYADFFVVGYWDKPPGDYHELSVALPDSTNDATWEDIDLGLFGIPSNSVAEFVLCNQEYSIQNNMGVRPTYNFLDLDYIYERRLRIRNTDTDFSDRTACMHVNVNLLSGVQIYHEDCSEAHEFRVIGYWDNFKILPDFISESGLTLYTKGWGTTSIDCFYTINDAGETIPSDYPNGLQLCAYWTAICATSGNGSGNYLGEPAPCLPLYIKGLMETSGNLYIRGLVENTKEFETTDILWLDNDDDPFRCKIQRYNLSNESISDVLNTGDESIITRYSYGLTVDSTDRKVYWCDYKEGYEYIARCDLDGSNIEIVVDKIDCPEPYAIVFDHVNRKLYWADKYTTTDEKIKCWDLATSGITTIVTGLRSVVSIAIDPYNEKIYWCDNYTTYNHIGRADIDDENKNIEILYDPTVGATLTSVDVDVIYGEYVYFIDQTNDNICRFSMVMPDGQDGTNRTDIEILKHVLSASGDGNAPVSLIVDARNNRLYWTDAGIYEGIRYLDLIDYSTVLLADDVLGVEDPYPIALLGDPVAFSLSGNCDFSLQSVEFTSTSGTETPYPLSHGYNENDFDYPWGGPSLDLIMAKGYGIFPVSGVSEMYISCAYPISGIPPWSPEYPSGLLLYTKGYAETNDIHSLYIEGSGLFGINKSCPLIIGNYIDSSSGLIRENCAIFYHGHCGDSTYNNHYDHIQNREWPNQYFGWRGVKFLGIPDAKITTGDGVDPYYDDMGYGIWAYPESSGDWWHNRNNILYHMYIPGFTDAEDYEWPSDTAITGATSTNGNGSESWTTVFWMSGATQSGNVMDVGWFYTSQYGTPRLAEPRQHLGIKLTSESGIVVTTSVRDVPYDRELLKWYANWWGGTTHYGTPTSTWPSWNDELGGEEYHTWYEEWPEIQIVHNDIAFFALHADFIPADFDYPAHMKVYLSVDGAPWIFVGSGTTGPPVHSIQTYGSADLPVNREPEQSIGWKIQNTIGSPAIQEIVFWKNAQQFSSDELRDLQRIAFEFNRPLDEYKPTIVPTDNQIIRSLFPSGYTTPNQSIKVTLTVGIGNYGKRADAYLIEERPPSEWTVSGVENYGYYDGETIRWINHDNHPDVYMEYADIDSEFGSPGRRQPLPTKQFSYYLNSPHHLFGSYDFGGSGIFLGGEFGGINPITISGISAINELTVDNVYHNNNNSILYISGDTLPSETQTINFYTAGPIFVSASGRIVDIIGNLEPGIWLYTQGPIPYYDEFNLFCEAGKAAQIRLHICGPNFIQSQDYTTPYGESIGDMFIRGYNHVASSGSEYSPLYPSGLTLHIGDGHYEINADQYPSGMPMFITGPSGYNNQVNLFIPAGIWTEPKGGDWDSYQPDPLNLYIHGYSLGPPFTNPDIKEDGYGLVFYQNLEPSGSFHGPEFVENIGWNCRRENDPTSINVFQPWMGQTRSTHKDYYYQSFWSLKDLPKTEGYADFIINNQPADNITVCFWASGLWAQCNNENQGVISRAYYDIENTENYHYGPESLSNDSTHALVGWGVQEKIAHGLGIKTYRLAIEDSDYTYPEAYYPTNSVDFIDSSGNSTYWYSPQTVSGHVVREFQDRIQIWFTCHSGAMHTGIDNSGITMHFFPWITLRTFVQDEWFAWSGWDEEDDYDDVCAAIPRPSSTVLPYRHFILLRAEYNHSISQAKVYYSINGDGWNLAGTANGVTGLTNYQIDENDYSHPCSIWIQGDCDLHSSVSWHQNRTTVEEVCLWRNISRFSRRCNETLYNFGRDGGYQLSLDHWGDYQFDFGEGYAWGIDMFLMGPSPRSGIMNHYIKGPEFTCTSGTPPEWDANDLTQQINFPPYARDLADGIPSEFRHTIEQFTNPWASGPGALNFICQGPYFIGTSGGPGDIPPSAVRQNAWQSGGPSLNLISCGPCFVGTSGGPGDIAPSAIRHEFFQNIGPESGCTLYTTGPTNINVIDQISGLYPSGLTLDINGPEFICTSGYVSASGREYYPHFYNPDNFMFPSGGPSLDIITSGYGFINDSMTLVVGKTFRQTYVLYLQTADNDETGTLNLYIYGHASGTNPVYWYNNDISLFLEAFGNLPDDIGGGAISWPMFLKTTSGSNPISEPWSLYLEADTTTTRNLSLSIYGHASGAGPHGPEISNAIDMYIDNTPDDWRRIGFTPYSQEKSLFLRVSQGTYKNIDMYISGIVPILFETSSCLFIEGFSDETSDEILLYTFGVSGTINNQQMLNYPSGLTLFIELGTGWMYTNNHLYTHGY